MATVQDLHDFADEFRHYLLRHQDDLKHCSKCMQLKPRAAFYKNKHTRDGLGSWCKECSKEGSKEYNHKYRKTSKGKITKQRGRHKRRAATKNTVCEFGLQEKQHILEIQKNRCADCGKKFCRSRPPTFDHIYPVSRGGDFVSWNVRAVCGSCNSKKQDKLRKDLIQIWAYLSTPGVASSVVASNKRATTLVPPSTE